MNNCTVSNNVAVLFPIDPQYVGQGGGVYGCTVQNSLIISNSAQYNQSPNEGFGGGACDSTLANCLIQGNRAGDGGGVVVYPGYPVNNGVLTRCTLIGNWAYGYGGGFAGNGGQSPTLTNCVINGNRAGYGGGVYFARLLNCLVADNVATNIGGGVDDGLLYNCTISQNSATTQSGGMYACSAYDSIVYYNTAPQSPDVGGTYSAKNCCFGQGVSSGTGFFTNAPQFVNLLGGDFHLQSNSPCINAGNNAYTNTTTDLDGNPRIVAGTVDIGAYEYQSPVSMVSYLWLEQYGLPITTNTDTSSPDGTAFDVYQDWIAGLNPTNPASVLAMLPLATSNTTTTGIKVTWQSVSGILYNLQRSTNLAAPPFITLQGNLTGQASTTSYTDTTATNGGPYFYRVVVP